MYGFVLICNAFEKSVYGLVLLKFGKYLFESIFLRILESIHKPKLSNKLFSAIKLWLSVLISKGP